MKTSSPLLTPLLVLVACGGEATSPDLTPDVIRDRRVQVVERAAGGHRLIIDATDEADFVPVDLSLPGEASDGWDLRVSRFRARTNGGVSGDAGVQAAPVVGVAFEALTQAPANGYVQDVFEDGADPGTPDFVPDSNVLGAFEQPNAASPNGWYVYDPATHVLSPADVTYAVRTRSGAFVALRFVDYYDAAGTPGVLTIDVAPIAAPAQDALTGLDANEARYLSVAGELVDGQAPLGWDVAIERTWMRTNSGLSGAGAGGARWAPEGVAFEDLTAAPTVGYLQDDLLPLPGPPGSGEAPGNPVLNDWYDYDPVSHRLSPKAGVLIVRGAAGGYAKLAVDAYADGTYDLRMAPLAASPELVTRDVTLGSRFTLLNLATGAVVAEVEAPNAASGWDLAIAIDRVWTRGGALAVGSFDAVDAPPSDPYVLDEMQDGLRSHPALTEALSAGGAFVMPVADPPGFAKLELQAVGDVVTVRWVFTGPGRETFR